MKISSPSVPPKPAFLSVVEQERIEDERRRVKLLEDAAGSGDIRRLDSAMMSEICTHVKWDRLPLVAD